MNIFSYDKTFEGLLTAVFDAYYFKTYPDQLISLDAVPPLFYDSLSTVVSKEDKANRVWVALQKKLSRRACNHIVYVWQSEIENSDMLIFRYICKIIDSKNFIETDFTDPDILKMRQLAKKVSKEIHALMQFIRFQKTTENIYFSVCAPQFNVLPFTINHFKDRFADQLWVLYDEKRQFGYFYDKKQVAEIELDDDAIQNGKLNETLLANDECLFQNLWRCYFRSINIKERANPKAQRSFMPKRFWQYQPEMQNN